jgi:HPt (histidine-containing phosphotransfer) domain-containing protein
MLLTDSENLEWLVRGVRGLISHERVLKYLRDLESQISHVAVAAAGDPNLQSQAHKIVSQAGMLGLTRMSECARALENACRSGIEPAEALRQCRAAAGDIRLYALPAAESLICQAT